MMKTVLTVNCKLPGGLGEFVNFDSTTSLMDADIVLFCPGLGHFDSSQTYKGKPQLSDSSSSVLQETIIHWQNEVRDFLTAGKTVFIMLDVQELVYLGTGRYSRSGRNPLSNYDVFPFSIKIIEAKGTSMKLHPDGALLREYWRQFGDESEYRAYMEAPKFFNPLVVTRNGNRIVGAVSRIKGGGAVVALPWINFYREEFCGKKRGYGSYNFGAEINFVKDYELVGNWTPKAIGWGERYLMALESLDNTIKSQGESTPVPQWARDEMFRTNQEIALSEELAQIQSKISDLETKREKVNEKLADSGFLKGLLFEKGHELEKAILEAMRLMGFTANNYRDCDSEFDAVLECPEGRCIGEAEGRDSKPISIEKMRQLLDNIHEDFSREEVSEQAKGILFGNAYRLSSPSDRPDEHFTPKCIMAARRYGTALIRTCDLFNVAKGLIDNPDKEYAALCRKAIFNAAGKVVRFPARSRAEAPRDEVLPDPCG